MNADDLAKIIDELGRRLGPTGQHVFDLAIRQVYIDNLIFFVWVGLLIVLAAFLWRRSLVGDSFDRGPLQAIAIGCVAVAVGLGGYALSQILNPEWIAVRGILKAIGS